MPVPFGDGFFYCQNLAQPVRSGQVMRPSTREIMSNSATKDYVDLKRSIYREYSSSYDEDRKRFVNADALLRRIAWALEPLTPGQRLLDLGCGSGELLSYAAQQISGDRPLGDNQLNKTDLVGMDLTAEMVALAKNRDLDRQVAIQVNIMEGNVLDGFPFQPASFHLATSMNLIQELPSEALSSFLAEVERVLVPGGEFRAVIPCMAENNPASQAFAQLAVDQGAMEFLHVDDLKHRLESIPFLGNKHFNFLPSPAATAAARGTTRFNFFTGLQQQVKSMGLDPTQVKQGVVFFSGSRQ